MVMTDEQIIDTIERHEGWPKYTNDPHDLGGPTKGGITLETLRRWRRDPSVTIEDLKALSRTEARAIYQFEFLQPFALLTDPDLRHYCIDLGVMRGPRRAAMVLQEIIGAEADGWIGAKTLAALEPFADHVLVMMIGSRFTHIEARVRENASQKRFRNGWRNRNRGFLPALAIVLGVAAGVEAAPIHINVQGPTSGTCISAGPHVWTTTVGTGHGGGHFRWAGYHSHRSGCEPTGENGASSYFIVDGPVEFSAGLGGLTTWAFQQPGDKCGRMQYDIDWFDWLTGWVLGVAGIMVDYGFDCRYHPPGNGEPRDAVPEPATLLLLGLGLLWVRKRVR